MSTVPVENGKKKPERRWHICHVKETVRWGAVAGRVAEWEVVQDKMMQNGRTVCKTGVPKILHAERQRVAARVAAGAAVAAAVEETVVSAPETVSSDSVCRYCLPATR